MAIYVMAVAVRVVMVGEAAVVVVALASSAVVWAVARRPMTLIWVQVRFGRDLDADGLVGFFAAVASDHGATPVVVETVGTSGRVGFRLGAAPGAMARVVASLEAFCPGVSTEAAPRSVTVSLAASLRPSDRRRPLAVTGADSAVTTAVLSVLAATAVGDCVVVQWVLGPRLSAMAVPNRLEAMPPTGVADVARLVISGPSQSGVDPERRRALRDKTAMAGFRATCRVGVHSRDGGTGRAHRLIRDVVAALRVGESPGVKFSAHNAKPGPVAAADPPRRFPFALNIAEVTRLVGWPIGDGPYPGVDRARSRLVEIPAVVAGTGRVVGEGTHPRSRRPVALNPPEALAHTHVIGPTGVGKSTLLENLIISDIAAGRGVVAVDPKGDLIDAVLARIPDDRVDDVVVIDPSDRTRPVGINPLRATSRRPELVADHVVAVFKGLYRDSWGPRLADVLHASVLTLAGRDDVSLCALPVLLTNDAYRRRIVGSVDDPIGLSAFWAWFDAMSPAERHQVIAPVMNRLRAFILAPTMRSVIGQTQPRVDIGEVFTRRRVVLVSLAKGLVGADSAGLLGSLVISELWQATRERAAIAPGRRHPVMVYVDEFQDYLHLPTDLAEVLAQARGLGVGLTLAHQHLDQLTRDVRAAVLANARNRICFQLSDDDAGVVSKRATGLDASDFVGLGRYEIYANLVTATGTSGFVSAKTRPTGDPVRDPDEVRARSRTRFGVDAADVDADIADLAGTGRSRDTNTGHNTRGHDGGGDVGARRRR